MSEKRMMLQSRNFVKNNTMLFFLIILFVASMIFVPRFATTGNILNVLIQISINALIACGMTFVILSDGIDLSVGSVAALAGVVGASAIKQMPDAKIPMSLLMILLTSLVIGGICGGINGFCVAKLNVPPFIATLAMMNVARGLAYVATDAKPVFGLPESFGFVGLRKLGPIPVSIILMVIILIISVEKIRFSVYIISGFLSALGGLVLASKLQNGQATAAQGYELNAIAAVAMGGTSMAGGRGGIIQTIFGLFVIGIINNTLSLLGVSSYWQTVAMGVIILIAVIIDQYRK